MHTCVGASLCSGFDCDSRYKLVYVYMIGGCTYEESLAVEQFNQTNPGYRVILGGSFLHNSTS